MKKAYIALAFIAVHASATIAVNLSAMSWAIGNGESLHPQPKPGFIQNLETAGSLLALPLLKVLSQGLQLMFQGSNFSDAFVYLLMLTVVVINSASLAALGIGIWMVVERVRKA